MFNNAPQSSKKQHTSQNEQHLWIEQLQALQSHLEEAQDAKELEHSHDTYHLHDFGGFEHADKAGSTVRKNHVPWQCRQNINQQETLSIVTCYLDLGCHQNISCFARCESGSKVQQNV
jgi:hypothetical protein